MRSHSARKIYAISILLMGGLWLLFPRGVDAANGINKAIMFQGKVVNSNGTNVTDGTYDFVFKLYDGALGASSTLFTETWSTAALWSSTMSSAPGSGGESTTYSSDTNEATIKVGQILWNTTKQESVIITAVNTGTNVITHSPTRQAWAGADTITNKIYVKDGVFRVALNTLNADLSGVNFGTDNIFLGVNFNADGEMKPRIQYSAVPYAFNAEKVNGLTVTNTSNNPFTTTTTLKIGDGKTVVISNGLTFTGTDTTSFAFPSTGGNMVTEDFAQILTNKTIGSTGLTFTGASLDLTTGTNEDFIVTPNGTGNTVLTTDFNSGVLIGSTVNTLAPLSVSGGIGGNAAAIINQTLSGDLFVASQAGATKFLITNGGSINLAAGQGIDALTSGAISLGNGSLTTGVTIGRSGGTITLPGFATNNNSVLYTGASGVLGAATTTNTNECLVSNGSNAAPTWGACPGSGTASYWVLDGPTGLLYNGNQTTDVLFGGSATSSAKFAFLNVTAGIPVASVSAGAAGASSIAANGIIATTNKQSLTLGASSTGNILIGTDATARTINIGNGTSNTGINLTTGTGNLAINTNQLYVQQTSGNVGIGTTAPNASLQVVGNSATVPTASISARTNFAALVVDNTIGDLFTASSAGLPRFTVANNGVITATAYTTANGLLSTDGLGVVNQTAAGVSTQCLKGDLTWGACGAGEKVHAVYTATTGTNIQVQFTGNPDSAPSAGGGFLTLPSNTSRILVVTRGGGGGGGGIGAANALKGAGGGGEGGYSEELISSLASTYYFTVGTGGTAGSIAGGTGGTGNSSCFGTNATACTGPMLSATGGVGGVGSNATGARAGGAGGTASGGDLNLTGDSGDNSGTATNAIFSGGGGGAGGGVGLTASGVGNNGANGGGGGGGLTQPAGVTTRTGGTGGDGYVTVYVYTNNPDTTNYWQGSNGTVSPAEITNDVLFGGFATSSAKFRFLNNAGGTPVASISGNSGNIATFLTGLGNFGTTNGQTLTIGGSTTGNIILNPRNAASGGYIAPAADNVTNLGASSSARFKSLYLGPGSLHIQCLVSDGCGQELDYEFGVDANTGKFQIGVNSDSSNQNPVFTIEQGGRVNIEGSLNVTQGISANGTAGVSLTDANCLNVSSGIVTGSGSCPVSLNYWDFAGGALMPKLASVADLLLGGTSTASAKFAFINNLTGTPTASISANSGNNALYITGNGTLASTSKGNITIGNSTAYNTTGNILLNPNGVGNIGIGTDAPGSLLDILTPSLTASGANAVNLITTFAPTGGGAQHGVNIDLTNAPSGAPNTAAAVYTTVNDASVEGNTVYGSYTNLNLSGDAVKNSYGASYLVSESSNTAGSIHGINIGMSRTGDTNSAVSRTYGMLINAQTSGAAVSATQHIYGIDVSVNTANAVSGTVNEYGVRVKNAISAVGAGATLNHYGIYIENPTIGTTGTTNNTGLYVATATGADNNYTAIFQGGKIGMGTTAPDSNLQVTGTPSGKALMTLNNTGIDQDIFTASASGAPKFSIGYNGTLSLVGGQTTDIDTFSNTTLNIGATTATILSLGRSGQGITLPGFTAQNGVLFGTQTTGVLGQVTTASTGLCLLSGASSPNWGSCSGSAAATGWDIFSGALRPNQATVVDLLLGGTSTASAKFAFTNVLTGTPTASISAGGTGGISINATGTIATTTNQSLILGSTTTGNILIGTDATARVINIGNATGATALNMITGTGNFAINTNQLFVQKSSGNIGIGNLTPLAALDVTGSASLSANLSFDGTYDGSHTIDVLNGNALNIRRSVGGDTALTSSFFIDKYGNVGIGTTTPGNLLELSSTTTPSLLSISGSSKGKALMILNQTGNQDIFTASTAGVTRFTIDSAGNASMSGTMTVGNAGVLRSSSGALNLAYKSGTNAWTNGLTILDNSGNIGIGTTAPVGKFNVSGQSTGISLVTFNQGGDQAILTGSQAGVTKFVFNNNGNLGLGTTNPTEKLNVNGNIRIEQKTNSTTAEQQLWTKLSGATGTIGGGATGSIASISAMVSYNGSMYVGTSKLNEAEIYRYSGTAGTWSKVSQTTAGTIAAAGTTAIDTVSAMVVYNGTIYAGTTENNTGQVYRYDGGTTWTLVSGGPGTGDFAAAGDNTDGISSMAVYGGRLYAGSFEPMKAQLYMYRGGTSWLAVNTTAGTFQTTNSVSVDRVSSMAVSGGFLYLGTYKGTAGGADLLRYNGGSGASLFNKINSATSGTFLINSVSVTNVVDVPTMANYNGRLAVGIYKANAGEVLVFPDAPNSATALNNFTRLGSAAGTLDSGGTASIDQISSLVMYQGRLYAGTTEPNAAQIYRYNSDGNWTVVSSGLGTVAGGGTASIDSNAKLAQFNGVLYAGTAEPTSAEVYSYTVSVDESYALEFHAGISPLGGEQNSLTNDGQISFVASNSASANSTGATTGSFLFSHGILTNFGAYDVAEDYGSRDDQLEAGDVVALDQNEGEMVNRSSSPYQKGIIGVFSEKPGLHLSQKGDELNGGRAIPVALAGRVPVKVSTENGAIKIGDLLTSSKIPGVAMRATKSGAVIGHAMQEFDGEGVGKITVYINPSSSTGSGLETLLPGLTNIDIGTDDYARAVLLQFVKHPVQEPGVVLAEMSTDRLSAGLEVITPKVITDTILLNKLQPATGKTISLELGADGSFIIADQQGKPAITFDAQGNGTFAGTITAKKIKADQIEGLDVLIGKLSFGTQNTTGNVLSASTSSALSFTQSFTNDQLLQSIQDPQKVSQPISPTFMHDANIIHKTNSLVDITSLTASLSAMNSNLTVTSLQVDGLASVSADLRVKGSSLIEGILTVIDSITTQRLFVSDLASFFGDVVFKKEVRFEGRPVFNNDTAGFAVIKKGAQKVTIRFDKEYSSDPIVTSSIDLSVAKDTDGKDENEDTTAARILAEGYSFILSKKSTKGFTIILNKIATEDIRFSWSAVSIKDALTAEGKELLTPTPILSLPQPTIAPPGDPTKSVVSQSTQTTQQTNAEAPPM